MILDTSAVVAVFLREPTAETLEGKIGRASRVGIGAPTLVETALVLTSRYSEDAGGDLQRFLRNAEVEVIPFGEGHWQAATEAFLRFGKGRHPAKLNFGGCMSYATAKLAAQPLLYVGDDFAQTDLELA